MLKQIVSRVPLLNRVAKTAIMSLRRRTFQSPSYWEKRYATGGSSGHGSTGDLAAFKADTVNSFVKEYNVRSVVEFGCGDGDQLSLANYPEYVGLDISPTAIETCRGRFASDATKRFFLYTRGNSAYRADMALSLDVIYHLVEDAIFQAYMTDLLGSADRYVVIYSDNRDFFEPNYPHVRHRQFE